MRNFSLILLLFISISGNAQIIDISQSPTLQKGLSWIESQKSISAESLIKIGGIISPSGQEHERAEAVMQEMKRIGLQNVRMDSGPNVIGIIPGQRTEQLVFVSTLDDLAGVAEHQQAANKQPYIADGKVIGPGTNTSSITVSMLLAAEAILETGIKPQYTLVFASVAQEETGLQGMKLLYNEFKNNAIAFVDILGDGRSLSYGALGIHWWKIQVSGPPGHSLNGGLPNVNQGIGRAIDRILSLDYPIRYKDQNTVINVGMIESGNVFNHKPEQGWFSLDIRSLDGKVIDEIETEVASIIVKVGEETGVTLEMEPFQLTPGGQIPGALESELVTTGISISQFLGYEPSLSNRGSSNLNVAISQGTPALGLGGERGGRRGFADEWADIESMNKSAKHVFLLAALLGTR
jgi:acetylornithine deacetylase/succinyl-diaminopimelate desuccinylase-like protein